MNKPISKIKISKDFNALDQMEKDVLSAYSIVIASTKTESNKLNLGTSLLLLKSIFIHLDSLKLLIENCRIESTGAVATSLWEKSIMLQYVLMNPSQRIPVYTTHTNFRKLPWTVRTMVQDITRNEVLPKGKSKEDNFDLLYLQYSYLCAIKHGNPFTLSYLNSFNDTQSFFSPRSIIREGDKDILALLYSYSIVASFDAIKAYAKIFCLEKQFELLKNVDIQITNTVSNLSLKVPTIITASAADFRPEFWNLLLSLRK